MLTPAPNSKLATTNSKPATYRGRLAGLDGYNAVMLTDLQTITEGLQIQNSLAPLPGRPGADISYIIQASSPFDPLDSSRSLRGRNAITELPWIAVSRDRAIEQLYLPSPNASSSEHLSSAPPGGEELATSLSILILERNVYKRTQELRIVYRK